MLTIRQAFDSFYLVNRPGLSRLTQNRYRDEIKRWERLTPNPLIDQITTQTFNEYRASCLSHGLKPSTVEGGIRTVLQVLRLCGPEQERRQGLGLIPKVPFVGRPLRQAMPLLHTPSVEDLRLAWQHADAAIWPRTAGCNPATFWRAWIGTMFVTGMRLSDALRAERKRLSGALLVIPAGKTGIHQIFPLPVWLLIELHQLPEWNGKLFPCRSLPCFVRRELRRISNAAGITKITPHALRRSCITEWSAINSDCGSIIHGSGLGIRSRYVDPLRLLRKHVAELPDISL